MLPWPLLLLLLSFGSLLAPILAAVDADGVPYPNDTSVIKHQSDQARLVNYEKKERNDYAFRKALSPTAKLADKIVARIRQVEAATIWNVAGTFGNESAESFAGEDFAIARPKIGTTDLFRVVKKLPKGSLLHAHLTAMLPYSMVFQTLLNTEGMVLSAATDLSTDKNRNVTAIYFEHVNTTISNSSASIWTPAYVPYTRIPAALAADTFPGGRAAFLAFLLDKLTLDILDADQDELGVDAIWRKFQNVFSTVGTAWSYEPLIRQFLQMLFAALADDGIQWVEIRNGGNNGVVKTGDSVASPDPNYWYNLFIDELAKFKSTPQGANFWGARFIWTVSRGKARAAVITDMKNAIAKKQSFPQLVAGYDLVSQEDLGRPLIDLAPELIWFQRQTQALNLTIPYFFHAGETLGDGNLTDNNLFDAEMFGTRRIGHGFSLYKHPLLMDKYKQKDIMVEVCLISNEALRLNGNILQHPLPAMIAHGVPTSLSNDDPAIEGQDDAGLSYDYFEAIQGFQNLGLAGIGALAQNSIRYSNFVDQNDEAWIADIEAGANGYGVKAAHLQEWNREWETFCAWVVSEFGGKYNVTATS